MHVRFWGVRGSIASAGPEVALVGGNTPCVEIESGGHHLILDAGTGARPLGEALSRRGVHHAAFLFSHLHWDHLQGFPFFAPAWSPLSELQLFGPGVEGASRLETALARQMEAPTFPVPLHAMGAKLNFRSAIAGQTLEFGPFKVRPLDLPHPQGCLGYRIEADGCSFAYCTDVELSPPSVPLELMRALAGVDVLALDAQFTRAEYDGAVGPSRRGWGHSTNLDAARVAKDLGVGQLYLFHHDPSHRDEQVEAMAAEARQLFARTEPARESTRLQLGG